MGIPDDFLEELRARLPVSAVVGRTHKLRKAGAELRSIDDNSLTVNDAKALWWDHAKDEGGDIFAFIQKTEGVDFPEAVARCASIAGLPMPNGRDRSIANAGDDREGRSVHRGRDGGQVAAGV